jgi:hypothetical protein
MLDNLQGCAQHVSLVQSPFVYLVVICIASVPGCVLGPGSRRVCSHVTRFLYAHHAGMPTCWLPSPCWQCTAWLFGCQSACCCAQHTADPTSSGAIQLQQTCLHVQLLRPLSSSKVETCGADRTQCTVASARPRRNSSTVMSVRAALWKHC